MQSNATATTGGASAPPVAVDVRGLEKAFPGVHALRGVDFELRVGEIHGLVGENGAGKSTLVKMITGAYVPDSGTIEVFGRELAYGDPRAERDAGIAAIYQELNIVPRMSAAANVFLGKPRRRGPFVARAETRRRFRELAERVGVSIDAGAEAGILSVANQQMLEIMRALEADHRVLIMDEPTASLGPTERENLYDVVRGLKAEGVAVIYISHDLDEVLALCDRVSVMRGGSLVSTRSAAEWTPEMLVEQMLGHALRATSREEQRTVGDEVLKVEQLRVSTMVTDVSLTLRRGEILGLAGLVGAGRTEVLRALAGAEETAHGRLWINGGEVPWPATVRSALGIGIALAPEDRKSQGLVLPLAADTNVILSDLGSVASRLVLRSAARRARAQAIMAPLAFNTARLSQPAVNFSGGNQQKLVVGKWLHRRPAVLLLDEPTRGVDIGAKAEMFDVMTRLANEGMSVIFVSSELEEVVEVSDRIVVLARGRSIATLDRAEASVQKILNLVFNVEEEGHHDS